jgi:hypothetical protein
MRVKVKEEGQGIHPNELIVAIETRDGIERLVVHKRSIEDGAIEIGYPISEDDDHYLIELPQETMGGLWRIWVPQRSLKLSPTKQRKTA